VLVPVEDVVDGSVEDDRVEEEDVGDSDVVEPPGPSLVEAFGSQTIELALVTWLDVIVVWVRHEVDSLDEALPDPKGPNRKYAVPAAATMIMAMTATAATAIPVLSNTEYACAPDTTGGLPTDK